VIQRIYISRTVQVDTGIVANPGEKTDNIYNIQYNVKVIKKAQKATGEKDT